MENKYLRTWIYRSLVTVFVVTLIGVTAGISAVAFKNSKKEAPSYILKDIAESTYQVNATVEDKVIEKPFNDELVKVITDYYELEGTQEQQEKSLILYENTYMPNKGILYGSETFFNVHSIYEGEVTNITEDEVFGTIIEIKHKNNMISKYSSLKNADVSIGDTVQPGEVIGTSGSNKVVSVSQNCLLLEIIKDGEYVNPNKLYNKSIKEK